ncbi:MAG: two-component system response regulator [Bryobacteraceae bacterium]
MGTRGKVLLIDDDQDFRNSVRYLLENRGCEVIEADCGKEGLRLVLECRPDLILVDVMMECDSEGYGVTQAIKCQEAYAGCRNIPVIMVSSIQESPDQLFPMAPEAEMIRPDRYLTKPVDADVLFDLVDKALAGRSRQAVHPT